MSLASTYFQIVDDSFNIAEYSKRWEIKPYKSFSLSRFFSKTYFGEDDIKNINLSKLFKEDEKFSTNHIGLSIDSIHIQPLFDDLQIHLLTEISACHIKKTPVDIQTLIVPFYAMMTCNLVLSFDTTNDFIRDLVHDTSSSLEKYEILESIETILQKMYIKNFETSLDNLFEKISAYKIYYTVDNFIQDKNSSSNQKIEELLKNFRSSFNTFSFKSNDLSIDDLSKKLEQVSFFNEFPQHINVFYDENSNTSIFNDVFVEDSFPYIERMKLKTSNLLGNLENNQENYYIFKTQLTRNLLAQLLATANMYDNYEDITFSNQHNERVYDVVIASNKPINLEKYKELFKEALLAFKLSGENEYNIEVVNAIFQENLLNQAIPEAQPQKSIINKF